MPTIGPPSADSIAERRQAPLSLLEDGDLPHPELIEELDRAVVAEADLLGQVGVGGEREGPPRLDHELGELTRRVELADRLAQARGGELDRRAAGDDRFDGGLVEAPQVALRQWPPLAPDLDQVGVGEDVEKAGAGAAVEVLEVPGPDLLGRGVRLLPDVEAVVVDGGVALADEVDRADHVVEVARLQHLPGALLGTGDVVALDPETQRGRADELAIGVEVVFGVLDPERVTPEVERLAEAVDVLGDAQLLDPGGVGGGPVALRVLGGEVTLEGGSVLVGAEVEVVIGEHG